MKWERERKIRDELYLPEISDKIKSHPFYFDLMVGADAASIIETAMVRQMEMNDGFYRTPKEVEGLMLLEKELSLRKKH